MQECSPRPTVRNLRKLLAAIMALAMVMSLGLTPAMAAETVDEDAVTARVLANTAKELRLSVYDLEVKAGDTYDVRVIPTKIAKMFGWEIGEVISSNPEYLAVDSVDQETMSFKLRGLKTGGKVSFSVEMENPVLNELVENNPALETYVKEVETAFEATMACAVATNDTGTKALKGVDAGDPADATPKDLGVTIPSTTTEPVKPGPSGPDTPVGGGRYPGKPQSWW